MKQKVLIIRAVGIALFFAGLPVLQRLLLSPIYVAGYAQPLLAQIDRICSLMLLPGKLWVFRFWPPRNHQFPDGKVLAAAGFNFVLVFLVTVLALRVIARMRRKRQDAPIIQHDEEESAKSPDAPRTAGRRNFLLKAASGGLGLGAVVAGMYPVLIEPGWLTVRRLTVPIKDLPPSLNGLTIAQLTDFHHDEWISLAHVRDSIRLANALKPDIVALNGDYVTSKPAMIEPAINEMASLKPKIGTVAVLGNHDWWADPAETRRCFAKIDIPVIDNDRVFIGTDRRLKRESADGLCIGGVGDLWEDVVEPEKAFHGVPNQMPRLLMSHNPDVTEQGSIGAGEVRADLILSGHTHGGQVRLPIIGAPVVPSAYGQKYAQGLVNGPACRVHVSAGIGMALLPIRINVPPEIVLITLTRET